MYLSKHKSGIYYIYFITLSGKRKKISTKVKDKRKASKIFESFDPFIFEKEESKTTLKLKDLLWKFLLYSQAYHTWKTTLQYKTTFNFFTKFVGNRYTHTIKTIEIEEFIQKRIKSVSLHAGRKDLINIKAVFNWGVKMELINTNPAINIRRIKPPQKLPLFFTQEEYNKLIGVIDNSIIKSIVEIAVNTGMRQMEILSLQWTQINLTQGFVILNNQFHITKGKRVRTIPLNQKCINIFIQLSSQKENQNVFNFNGEQMKQDYLVKNYKKFVLKAGINSKLNFHSLRHTFASWLVQRGVSIYHVSKLLGHADIKTTEIYAHLRADDLRESINVLNG